jgi:tetratricopeptide (TPR) repeat protein
MTKDNILFSIIGLLLGVIAGYMFATTVNQQGYPRRQPAATRTAGQIASGEELPENHPPVQGDAGADDSAAPSEDLAAAVERAQAEPDNFEAQMEAARIHYQNRNFDEALGFLTRANQLRPDNYETVVALGNVNFDAGRYEIAEKWYTAALVKNPKDVNVRTDLGLTFLFREPPDVDRSIQEFRRSLEVDPSHEQTLQNLTVALTKKGNYDEADATLKKLAEVNPSNPGLTKLRSDLEAKRSSSKEPVGNAVRIPTH